MNNDFLKYFNSARLGYLSERENRIIELRYVLAGEKPYTLEQIGQKFTLSKERIRQILNKAFRRVRAKGSVQISRGEIDKPCAQLQKYLEEVLKPQEPGLTERVLLLIKETLPDTPILSYAVPLILQCALNKSSFRAALKEIKANFPGGGQQPGIIINKIEY